MKKKVAFIGLGVMGYPMAGHLSRAGHQVSVYNRTHSKALQWCEHYQGDVHDSPGAAARDADMVFICVGRDDDVRAVMDGADGILAALSEGSCVIDHSTTSAQLAREMAQRCAERNLSFIDAPVSGGQQGAESGRLTVMCGGDDDAFARVEPVMTCYAHSIKYLGPAGSGQLCKMVNQICIAGLVQGLAEGLSFAETAGLDRKQVIDVIAKGAAQSWQMENRHDTMIAGQYDHGFAVDWMRKDLGIVLDEARRSGVALPVTALVDQFYADVQNLGGGRWDTSSLYARLQHMKKQAK
ncbi:MAG: NAD(P)-dependent oxidoreductase [Porticoccaceae bacterium]